MPASYPAVADDGRYVVFVSEDPTLVAGDSNGAADVFVRDTCRGGGAGCTPSRITSYNVCYTKLLRFDPQQRAFYYVRVLEIPTPSWVAYDEKMFAMRAPKEALRKQQERAYTSPIWYTP